MIRRLPVLFFCLLSLSSLAQWDDKDRLTKEFHKSRREALRALMPEKSAAVFFANPIRNRSNDVDFQYSQNTNFYYLSGYLEPDAVLVIFKEPRTFDGVATDELLFVQQRDPKSELWTGKRLGTEGAKKQLGFNVVYNGIEWKGFGINWKTLSEIFVEYPDLPNDTKFGKADLADLVNYFNESISESGKEINRSGVLSMMGKLREKKLPEEIVLLQKAVDITIQGFTDMIKRVQPGMKEYEAQAVIEYHAKKNGAEYMGYPSICGGGENACVLHYTFNRKELQAQEMLLVDMGAEYHGYTADITRTVPVDGKFSEEEAAIYNLVLQAQNAGIEACKKGADFRAAHRIAYEVIAKGLVGLGIITNESDASKYFMHGTSHYLGLDVHDPGTYTALQPGVVMTVEPGIYIANGSPCDKKWWDIGIRIEDDILITDGAPIILSGSLPRTITALEALMRE
jgi:Xaa-Pro aminopeptidase